MKKLIAISLLLFSLSSYAQISIPLERENFFRFGVKAGVNINKISGQSYSSGFNFNYQLGAFAQFNFSNRFGLQPEINFVQASSEFSNDQTDIYSDLFLGGSQKSAKLSYLEIPLLLNINVGISKHVKIQIGPSYGALLNKTINNLRSYNTDSLNYKKADWSAIGGLWIQLPLINFGARYKLGLSDVNNSLKSETWRNQAIQIFVGVTF